ncbi:MAG TPA: hypothetical protein VHB98_00830 [Chloroflexota bacterium]|jgi:hypothetical protein|nr:hypothetical protein [Chloroflexota bacterium]
MITLQRRKELFLVACTATLVFAVLGALNLGGIEPFHSRQVGLALVFFVLAIIALAGANFTRPVEAQS